MSESSDDQQVVLLFCFFSLFIGAIITYLLSRFAPAVPYTVVIFGVGSLSAFMITGSRGEDKENGLLKSLEMWNNIPPNLILFVFLPALLFGESMNLNFHHIKGAMPSSLLLAGPGAIIGTIAVAALVRYTFAYDWSWSLCLVFGSITCATDPVAVVALLKKAGAPVRLTYIVILEALLNDGTAVVLFTLLFSLIEVGAEPITAFGTFLYFVRVVFISPLLGISFGFGALYAISLANKRMKEEDNIVQVAITICTAYLSFYVGQESLGVSGVISCCAAGVVLARYAHPMIVKPESMKSIWEAFEWIGNTLIFNLAGLIIGSGMVGYIEPIDIVFILLGYVWIFVIRFATVFCFYPLMTRMGRGCTINEAIFMSYGGLRGAVSVALALSLVHATSQGQTTISQRDAQRCFFIIGGIAALTLIVNATSSGTVLQALQLVGDSNASSEATIIREYVRKRMRLKAIELLEKIEEKFPTSVDPALVLEMCSIFAKEQRVPVENHSLMSFSYDNIVPNHQSSRNNDTNNQSNEKANTNAELLKSSSLSDDLLDKSVLIPERGSPTLFHPLSPISESNKEIEAKSAKKNNTEQASAESTQIQTRQSDKFGSAEVPERNISPVTHYEDKVKSESNAASHSSKTLSKMLSYNEFIDNKITHIAELVASTAGAQSKSTIARMRQRAQSWCSPEMLTHEEGQEEEESDSIDHGSGNQNNQLDDRGVVPDASSPADPPIELNINEQPRDNNNNNNEVAVDSSSISKPPVVDPSTLRIRSGTMRRLSDPDMPRHGTTSSSRSLRASTRNRTKSIFAMSFNFSAVRPDVISQTRRAFLEVVRVNYWRQINSGRLPRKSNVASILLNSIDFALETINTPGLQDWDYIVEEHKYLIEDLMDQAGVTSESHKNSRRICAQNHAKLSCLWCRNSLRCWVLPSEERNQDSESNVGLSGHLTIQQKQDLREYRHSQAVYLLTGFVEAHEYAQRKIPFYLGESEGIDTLEEELVVHESEVLVSQVKKLIDLIDKDIMTTQLSKQAARWILHMEEDQIVEFKEEGILTGKDAEEMLEEIQHDFDALRESKWSKTIVTEVYWLQAINKFVLYPLRVVIIALTCCDICRYNHDPKLH